MKTTNKIKTFFKNEQHRKIFTQRAEQLNSEDNKLMAAIYLLTADLYLWKQAKKNVDSSGINFNDMKMVSFNDTDYTLFCGARDIFSGTKKITLCDLSDNRVINGRTFKLLCTAVLISRFGVYQ